MSIDRIPSPALDVRDLRLLLALVETGTTKGASARLHLAQPSVSRALCSLEERLDAKLFARTPRGLTPTPPCARIVEAAPALLRELQALGAIANDATPPKPVRLVCECYTAYHWLPSSLRALRSDMPDVRLALGLEHTRDPRTALQQGQVDAALLTSAWKNPPAGIAVTPLFSDELVFLLAPEHRLAQKKKLSPDDIRDTPLFLSRAPAPEREWFMRRVFGRARPRLDASIIPLTEAIVDLARAGMGLGIVTEWVAEPYLARGGVEARRFIRSLRRPWHLAYVREMGGIGTRLARILKQVERAKGL